MGTSVRILQYKQQVNWLDPKADYERINKLRSENLIQLTKNPGAVPALLRHYGKGRWAEFISDWCITFDPRELDPELRYRPFILYQRQIEYVDWVYQRYINRQRGAMRKPRGIGASWLDAAIGVIIWLTEPGGTVLYGSQKEEKVDNGEGDFDSLFEKMRYLIRTLPSIFVPKGWEQRKKKMLISNPDNGAQLKGEIGDKIGMGGRASLVFADEFAELEHPKIVEGSLAGTADAVLYVSTIPKSGYIGSRFHQIIAQLPSDQVFTFELADDERIWDDRTKTLEEQKWYQQKIVEITPDVFNTQYLGIDSAVTTNAYFPPNLIVAANKCRLSQIVQPWDVPWSIGVDASGMGSDEFVIWRRRGRYSLPLDNTTVLAKVNEVQGALAIQEVAKDCLSTAPIALIGIEKDGPGSGVATLLQYTSLAPVLVAMHTGIKLKDGLNYNLRAYLHRQAKEYLENEDPYLPSDPIFFAQVTAIQHKYKGGTLLIESKEDYRARLSGERSALGKQLGKSPDRADAFYISFAPPTGKLVTSFFNKQDMPVQSSKGWQPLDASIGY